MKILIETIPHASQRYDTCGDWTVSSEGNWHIRVSALHDWRREVLVAIHELIEMALCRSKGITTKEVDDFDMQYEQKLQHLAECNDGENCREFTHSFLRQETEAVEPGDCVDAPYYRQHQIAAGIERILAAEMAVDWLDYEKQIQNLAFTENSTS
jgi:hypothetical protein